MMLASMCAPPLDETELGGYCRGAGADLSHEDRRSGAPDDAFARLAGLVTANDCYLGELRALNARVASARAHLATNPPDPTLGRSYLDRARSRRSRVLSLLRANRIAAREFLRD